jgi:hypothetical protein
MLISVPPSLTLLMSTSRLVCNYFVAAKAMAWVARMLHCHKMSIHKLIKLLVPLALHHDGETLRLKHQPRAQLDQEMLGEADLLRSTHLLSHLIHTTNKVPIAVQFHPHHACQALDRTSKCDLTRVPNRARHRLHHQLAAHLHVISATQEIRGILEMSETQEIQEIQETLAMQGIRGILASSVIPANNVILAIPVTLVILVILVTPEILVIRVILATLENIILWVLIHLLDLAVRALVFHNPLLRQHSLKVLHLNRNVLLTRTMFLGLLDLPLSFLQLQMV